MGVAHQFCLSHQICCPIPATIKNCFTSLKGLCGVLFVLVPWWLDTVQDFLIKLGIKPRMHLLKIGIFHYIMSLSDLPKLWTPSSKIAVLYFQSHFSASVKNIRLGDQHLEIFFLKTLIFKVLCFLKMCVVFVVSVHNFGRSDNDMI